MTESTKTTVRFPDGRDIGHKSVMVCTVVGQGGPGAFPSGEDVYESLCSVELGETAKGEGQVKSVKVYAATPADAAIQALETFNSLRSHLKVVNESGDGEGA